MIKEVGFEMLDEVSEFVFKLNKIKKNQCRPFKVDYVLSAIKEKFAELIDHADDKLLVNIVNDELVGVLPLYADLDEKFLQGMPGIYAINNYQKVGNEFILYLQTKYNGFHILFAFPKENKDGIALMDNNEFVLEELASIYELSDFVDRINKEIIIMNNSEVSSEKVLAFYNEYQGDIYWTIDKIMENGSNWVLKHFVEHNTIKASIFVKIYDDISAEVFGIIREKDFYNDAVISELIIEAVIECQEMGIRVITLFSEFDSDSKVAENIGFNLVDTHLTYKKVL